MVGTLKTLLLYFYISFRRLDLIPCDLGGGGAPMDNTNNLQDLRFIGGGGGGRGGKGGGGFLTKKKNFKK